MEYKKDAQLNLSVPIPLNEMERLAAVRDLGSHTSINSDKFDQITYHTAKQLNTPFCFLSVIYSSKIKFLSSFGSEVKEIPREFGICTHVIAEIKTRNHFERLYEISNMLDDHKFRDNPLVCNSPEVRSYLGYTLQSANGCNLGTLCVMDSSPRNFSNENKFNLAVLGEIANKLLLGSIN